MAEHYVSQFQQDKFLDEVVFNRKDKGFFIDIGAHDGITISNTLFFETRKNWDGICIEPNPNVFEKLQQSRRSQNLNVCIGNGNRTVKFTKIDGYSEMLSGISEAYDKRHLERIHNEIAAKGGKMTEIDVDMITLDSIATLKGQKIDFISIDTEGNEFDIVKSINFKTLQISALVIENNYNDNRIRNYMQDLGYTLIYKLDCDEVFLRNEENSLGVQSRVFLWKSGILFHKIMSKLGLRK